MEGADLHELPLAEMEGVVSLVHRLLLLHPRQIAMGMEGADSHDYLVCPSLGEMEGAGRHLAKAMEDAGCLPLLQRRGS